MHPPAFAFVDLETTGTRAAADRITEIGIVRVDDALGLAPCVTEWSTLVDPEVPIPPAIQALTGITDAMVKSAPTFSTVSADVQQMIAGCAVIVIMSLSDPVLRRTIREMSWGKNLVSLLASVLVLVGLSLLPVPAVLAGVFAATVFIALSIKLRLIDLVLLSSLARSFTKR